VIRKTNTQIIAQVVNAKVIGDVTIASAISSELPEFGWNAGIGNLPAAYLTGLLAGLRAKAHGIDNAILDIGLNPPVKGSKIYAALKGSIDAGLEVPSNEDVFPDEARITGKHIVEAYNHFTEEKESAMFSDLGKKKTTITTIPKQFDKVKKALIEIPKAQLKKKPKKTSTTPKPKRTKKEKEKPAQKPPRAVPRKPKPKKLISRGKGKKGKRRRK
jgi:large subunit ribosomal protein L18